MQVCSGELASIEPRLLYRILRLRVDVFVVEQACPYPDLDGRDAEEGALLVWAEEDGTVLATLRLLRDDEHTLRIGRVATAAAARSRGLAGLLMQEALGHSDGAAVVLDAQSPLEGWYARFGFQRSGPEFIEDGIPHVPMRRSASDDANPAPRRSGSDDANQTQRRSGSDDANQTQRWSASDSAGNSPG
jgi:ElaA protein